MTDDYVDIEDLAERFNAGEVEAQEEMSSIFGEATKHLMQNAKGVFDAGVLCTLVHYKKINSECALHQASVHVLLKLAEYRQTEASRAFHHGDVDDFYSKLLATVVGFTEDYLGVKRSDGSAKGDAFRV